MANKITRTSSTTKVKVFIFDRLSKEAKEEEMYINGKWTDENEVFIELKRLTKKDTDTVINDVEILEVKEELREMSISDWMKYSTVVEA